MPCDWHMSGVSKEVQRLHNDSRSIPLLWPSPKFVLTDTNLWITKRSRMRRKIDLVQYTLNTISTWKKSLIKRVFQLNISCRISFNKHLNARILPLQRTTPVKKYGVFSMPLMALKAPSNMYVVLERSPLKMRNDTHVRLLSTLTEDGSQHSSVLMNGGSLHKTTAFQKFMSAIIVNGCKQQRQFPWIGKSCFDGSSLSKRRLLLYWLNM